MGKPLRPGFLESAARALFFLDADMAEVKVPAFPLQAEAALVFAADLPGPLDDLTVQPDHGDAVGHVQLQVVPLAGREGGLGLDWGA